ncbi:integrin beta-PS isoform X1 [Tribolium castaneum]|uniref:Integrin beta-PS-like Protein n=1 Tax=Tribolium castaneum TaxID=7070 RepID=A0A139WLJ6_TRICA|nr:PREDICTED: integrin beta-PS-like [Tribolium castaneum]KYB28697.1 Integrin beta-PS-like Protein [Tribolium castaneum]|eukprot:XP_008191034.1 PREDICTED: integrin beta-PS-like [Tribolium castaneum]
MRLISLLPLCYFLVPIRSHDSCKDLQTCHECIQEPECSWYLGTNVTVSRCFRNDAKTTGKYKEHVYNPNSTVSFVKHNLQKRILQLRKNVPVVLEVILTVPHDTILLPDVEYIEIEFIRNSSRHGKITVEAVECPENPSQLKQEIHLFTKKSSQNLTLDIELLCKCPCEKPDESYFNHPQCSGRGTLKCGICKCHSGFGKFCECDRPVDTKDCFYKKKECSGRGTCVCGVCNCDKRANYEERIFGKYCECDNFSCKRFRGKVCGGEGHGFCNCDRCFCYPGWGGKNCGTPDN